LLCFNLNLKVFPGKNEENVVHKKQLLFHNGF
jgi:hypothetical protein